VRPARTRRSVRRACRRWHPRLVRLTRGRWRALPQRATDHYLSRVVAGARHYRPGIHVVVLTPPPWRSEQYPLRHGHEAAVRAAREWALRERVRLVELDDIVEPMWQRGGGNPDGLHWDWPTHAAVAEAVASAAGAPALT
jgi:hypothetical protein